MINSFIQTLSNPAIVSLVLGFLVGVYTKIDFPSWISSAISLYLIFAIGLKGGLCLGVTNACTPPLLSLAAIGIALGFIQPFFYFKILGKISDLDTQTKAVISSQYGSISIVTFVTATSFLEQKAIDYSSFMSAIAGAMEIPAIISGLFLLRTIYAKKMNSFQILKKSLYDIVTTPKVTIIFIGFLTGFLLRAQHNNPLITLTLKPFILFLVLFMLDIGIKIAQQRNYIHQFTRPIISFALVSPMLNGILALFIAYFLKLSVGTSVLFASLLASASYIAVPAIMAIEAPNAKKVIYLPMALAITLPFNLLIGIPLFHWLATLLIQS